MPKQLGRFERRKKRQFRIRKKIKGNGEQPRLAVFRSARHIYVQAVDDLTGRTLAASSTRDKEVSKELKGYPGNTAAAALVGKSIAERLTKQGIQGAVFDRGGNRYIGRVRALAESARENGLKF